MENEILALNANQVVAYLQKEPREFTKADIIRFIEENGIRMVNFMPELCDQQQGLPAHHPVVW